MAAVWSTWFDDILPHLPQCQTALVTHELRRTAQDFFRRSRAWRVMLDPIYIAGNDSGIEVVPDETKLSLVQVEQGWLDGEPLNVDGVNSRALRDPTETGTPTVLSQNTPGFVNLEPIPEKGGALILRVSIFPADDATGLPDDIAVKFREDLRIGALARLMLLPQKPWSNDKLGAGYLTTYENRLINAKKLAARAYGPAGLGVRPDPI